MATLSVFHTPACSKSRRAVELLREREFPFDVVEYRKTPPDRATLERIVGLLGEGVTGLVRRDARFRELGLDEAAVATAAGVVDVLLVHPELMERPLIVRGDKAIIARPPERVLEMLD